MRPLGIALVLASLGAAAAAVACYDPVHDQEVAALGPEAPGVSPGPTHRPGQPCNVCHGGIGPANLRFSVAGTIYQTSQPGSGGASGASVGLEDSTMSTWTAKTNSVGNFFVLQSDWAPKYPLSVPNVSYDGTTVSMSTIDNRTGSCADCHTQSPGTNSQGQVYIQYTDAGTGGGG